jgi:hypothetical protein
MKEVLDEVLGQERASKIAAINISDALDGKLFSRAVDKALSDPTILNLVPDSKKLNAENMILIGMKSRRGDYGDIPQAKTFYADRFSSFAQIIVAILYANEPQILKAALTDAGFTDEEINSLIPDGQDIPPTPNPEIQNFMQRINDIEKARRAIATMA